jgi:hypothetical protein
MSQSCGMVPSGDPDGSRNASRGRVAQCDRV